MSFVIRTPTGHYLINDDKALTITASWHESNSNLFSEHNQMWLARESVMERYRDLIEREGYDYLYEELRPPLLYESDDPNFPSSLKGLRTRFIYFARPGLYHFIPAKR